MKTFYNVVNSVNCTVKEAHARVYCPEYWELVQFVLQNCEKLHSFRGLYDKKKRQRLIVLFTSDVMYKKYKRPPYTPPALARSFCKINLLHTKNSA